MKYLLIFLVACSLSSCKKDKENVIPFSEARYKITITGKWTAPAFAVPTGAHFTTFVGMVHNNLATIWKEGMLAGMEMEVLAETGGGGPLLNVIDSSIAARNALTLLLFAAPAANGVKEVNFYCNSQFAEVSFASMLGPTPDWFVGISGLPLYRDNQWVTDTTIDLYPLDAGTEDGDVFGYNNPASLPQQPIQLLQASQATVLANGNPVLAPIATVRFRKQL